MGAGEECAREFDLWFRAQDQTTQLHYALDHPEPAEWRGFYEDLKAD